MRENMIAGTKVALVTGCSSGIGEATAWALANAGYRVYATARNVEHLESLRKRAFESGLLLQARPLDVTKQGEINAVLSEIGREAGHLDVLVNNAGYALFGAIEEIPSEDMRRQFDVNVFGLVDVSKTALPLMRGNGGGTIVNISSVAGRVPAPLMGAYCSTKFSVEALSLAMRAEVHQFGIRVVIIEPGPVNTRFSENAIKASGHIIRRSDSPYASAYASIRTMYENDGPIGAPAERVAKVILRAVRAKNPKSRYSVRARDRLLSLAGSLVPTRVGQRFIRGYFHLNSNGR
jgi:NAD(P)-dependent dehydrogenase (short-subunit alcohol dehydrogenase family)